MFRPTATRIAAPRPPSGESLRGRDFREHAHCRPRSGRRSRLQDQADDQARFRGQCRHPSASGRSHESVHGDQDQDTEHCRALAKAGSRPRVGRAGERRRLVQRHAEHDRHPFHPACGLARVESGRQWSIPFVPGSTPELVDIHDTTAIYEEASSSPLGLATMIIRVECPAGSSNLKHDGAARTFSYEYEPKVAGQCTADAKFNVDHKDAIMSCLAKCYSNEHFAMLWAARGRFDNTGSATLSDYRVRFRIAGFTAWSPWHHTSKVYPGQAVVDPFIRCSISTSSTAHRSASGSARDRIRVHAAQRRESRRERFAEARHSRLQPDDLQRPAAFGNHDRWPTASNICRSCWPPSRLRTIR